MNFFLDENRRLLAEDPGNAEVQLSLAKQLVQAAWRDASSWNSHYDEALPLFESLLANDPENGVHLVNLGAVLSDRARYDRALTLYRRAEALGFEDANLDHNIGVALIGLQDEAQGIARLKASNNKQPHPDTIQAYFDPHGR